MFTVDHYNAVLFHMLSVYLLLVQKLSGELDEMKTVLQVLHQLSEPVKACVSSTDQQLVNSQLAYGFYLH